MLTFLFEQYGYYPSSFENNIFYIDNWMFKLLEIDYSDEKIKEFDSFNNFLNQQFDGKCSFIIKTRFDKVVSMYDNKRYVLISVYKCNMSIKDLNKFHCVCVEENKVIDLLKVVDMWEDRIINIENTAIGFLRIDSAYYKENVENTMFCIGLAVNAVQYLSEIVNDFGKNLEGLTIVHKRLKNLDSFEFFNPFNFIVDHPIKDFVDLYKNDFISFNELIDVLNFYKIDSKLASVFMARMLYPSFVFDSLDENVTKKEKDFHLKYNIEKEFSKLKKIYVHLKNFFNIRPIDWLEK